MESTNPIYSSQQLPNRSPCTWKKLEHLSCESSTLFLYIQWLLMNDFKCTCSCVMFKRTWIRLWNHRLSTKTLKLCIPCHWNVHNEQHHLTQCRLRKKWGMPCSRSMTSLQMRSQDHQTGYVIFSDPWTYCSSLIFTPVDSDDVLKWFMIWF